MTTDQIKNQITRFVRQFKENSGTFKSFEVIFNYINFLESEPYLKELITPVFTYLEDQLKTFEDIALNNPEQAKQMDSITFDPLNPASSLNLPVFSKEINRVKKALKNNENVPLIAGLSIYLLGLLVIGLKFQEIKDSQKAGDNKRANELIEIAKEESLALVSMPVKDNKPLTITSPQYLAMCLEMVNKYIVDQIDSQEFLANDLPKKLIDFDPKKSILYIRGKDIRIKRKIIPPIEHYILEAIFSKDLDEETDFKDICENFWKNEYNGSKDWHKFRHACDKLNKKVDKSTDGQYRDFIKYHTGETGWCKINPKYL